MSKILMDVPSDVLTYADSLVSERAALRSRLRLPPLYRLDILKELLRLGLRDFRERYGSLDGAFYDLSDEERRAAIAVRNIKTNAPPPDSKKRRASA